MWWTHFEHFGLLKNNNKKKHSELKVSVKWIKKLNFNDARNKNCREPHPCIGSQSVSPSLDLNLKNKLEKSAVSLNNEEKIFTWYLQKYLFYLVNGPSAPEPSLAGPRAPLWAAFVFNMVENSCSHTCVDATIDATPRVIPVFLHSFSSLHLWLWAGVACWCGVWCLLWVTKITYNFILIFHDHNNLPI